MVHFFSVYKTLEKKQTLVDEVGDRDEAIDILTASIERYKEYYVK